jgi:hypothetical protein
MQISGTGISPLTVKILKGFKPETTLALAWTQLSSGNWVATDRGYLSDKYECEISIAGTELYINDVINLFEANREALSNQVICSGFNADEHLWGEDIDYTGSVTANVMSIQQRNQSSWKVFNLSVRLAAVSPSFILGSGNLPLFRFTNIGVKADAEYTNQHFRSYRNVWSNPDMASDAGTFTGTFTLTVEEMAQLRSYIRLQRGATVSLVGIYGIQYPFGPRTVPNASGYPYNVKIIKFEDLGKISENFYQATITLAEQL